MSSVLYDDEDFKNLDRSGSEAGYKSEKSALTIRSSSTPPRCSKKISNSILGGRRPISKTPPLQASKPTTPQVKVETGYRGDDDLVPGYLFARKNSFNGTIKSKFGKTKGKGGKSQSRKMSRQTHPRHQVWKMPRRQVFRKSGVLPSATRQRMMFCGRMTC